MRVKSCEKLEKSQVALTVEVDAEELEAGVQKAYHKKGKTIRVPGFRPGKAPRQLIERMYGAEVFYADAIDFVWFDAYRAAVEQEKLQIVGDPKVEMEGDVTKEGFTFKAIVPVYPEVKLGEYKGLKAPKAEVVVTEDDVAKRLKELSDRNTRLVSVEHPAKEGSIAEIDYTGTENGKPFEGGSAENFSLEIGSGTFVPGFEDQVIGMKAGEEKDIDITFPKDYHKDLAGKAVVFHVKVNEVKEKDVPALDDEFAKDVSEFDTLAELKEDIKKKIAKDREDTAQQGFEDALIKQVGDNITCDVPDAMVEAQAHRFLENFRTQIQSQGVPYDQYLKISGVNEAKLLEDAKEPAMRQVRVDLALAAIIKEEKIESSDEEIKAEYEKMAEKYGMEVDAVKKYLQESLVSDQVKTDKAIAVVTESATATKPEKEEGEEAKTPAKKPAKKAEDGEKKPAAKRTTKKAEDGEKKPAAKRTTKKAEDGEKKPAAKRTTKKTTESK